VSRTISPSGNRALSPRAALRRTFGGMAVFISLPLLGLGGYLIRDQFENPLSSHPPGLLVAAVLIATALVLLSYLVHPGGAHQREVVIAEFEEPALSARAIDISASTPLAVRGDHSGMPIQSGYLEATANPPVPAQARGMAGK
jgi:hypothetical protein